MPHSRRGAVSTVAGDVGGWHPCKTSSVEPRAPSEMTAKKAKAGSNAHLGGHAEDLDHRLERDAAGSGVGRRDRCRSECQDRVRAARGLWLAHRGDRVRALEPRHVWISAKDTSDLPELQLGKSVGTSVWKGGGSRGSKCSTALAMKLRSGWLEWTVGGAGCGPLVALMSGMR